MGRAALLLLLLVPAALAAPAGWTIDGVVTDADGHPLAGASVSAWRDAQSDVDCVPPRPPAATATTDPNGRWVVSVDDQVDEEGEPTRRLLVVAEGPHGRRAVWLDRDALTASATITVHRLAVIVHVGRRPERELASRVVRVLDGDRPVQGVSVGGNTTDERGEVRLGLPVDGTPIDVELSRNDLAVRLPVALQGPGEVVVRMPRMEATISGTARLGGGGPPAPGLACAVSWVAFEAADGSLRVARKLDRATGAFVLPVPDDRPGVLAVHPFERVFFCGNGYTPHVAPDARWPAQAGDADLLLEVPDGTFAVRVLGPTGLPVSDARVVARLADGRTLEVTTGWWGWGRFLCVPPGSARVEVVDVAGRGEAAIEVPSGKESRTILRVR